MALIDMSNWSNNGSIRLLTLWKLLRMSLELLQLDKGSLTYLNF